MDLKSFCKGHAITDKTIAQLYVLYQGSNKRSKMTQYEFEKGLLGLNKRPARNVAEKVMIYVRENGFDCYEKFIREVEFITKDFWDDIQGIKFKDKNLFSTLFRQTHQQKVLETDTDSDNKYEKLLPIDWIKMDFSSRVDFVKKVKHSGFLNYLFEIDPKIKKYFSLIKKNPTKMKMYVTIYSFPSDTYSEESKNLLRSFIENLSMVGRADLQYIECHNPNIIEIREVR